MWTQFADFRLTTLYLSHTLEDPEQLDLRPVEKGANVWVVVPRDEGVFFAGESIDGIRCVHPVQVYIDLLSQPERAKDAAAHVRSTLLNWQAQPASLPGAGPVPHGRLSAPLLARAPGFGEA